MGISECIAKQFARPCGIGGRLIMNVMNRQNAALYDATEALLHAQDHETILDIGCGNGIMMERLASACDCRLIGTDISEDALSMAKQRLTSVSADLICCPVDEMPLKSASIDKALTVNTMYFWDDLSAGFAEIARVLKPGGAFISTHYTNRALEAFSHTRFGYKKHAESDIISAARTAGFDVETTPIMGGRAYCLVCRMCKRDVPNCT